MTTRDAVPREPFDVYRCKACGEPWPNYMTDPHAHECGLDAAPAAAPAAPAPDADAFVRDESTLSGRLRILRADASVRLLTFAEREEITAAAALIEQQARELARVQDAWRKECDDSDDLCEALGLRSDSYRTDGGWLNVPKIKAVLREKAERDLSAARAAIAAADAMRERTRALTWMAGEQKDLDAYDRLRAAMGDGNG